MKTLIWAVTFAALNVMAGFPELEVAFTVGQIEKGAPEITWTKNDDGSESTRITEKDGGIDLKDVILTRKTIDGKEKREVIYTLENTTKEIRYASFGWRTQLTIAGGDRNWFPTTDNVIDISQHSSFWGFYSLPSAWQFSLVEPWFASYNTYVKKGYAFLFDYNTLSAVYGARDLKTRGVLFDGGMLGAGKKITIKTVIRKIHGLSSLATVNEDFAAGFDGSATSPSLQICPFKDMKVSVDIQQKDMSGKVLGSRKISTEVKAQKSVVLGWFKSEKPTTQTVLMADLNGVKFEYFRENGFRMAPLPLVPPVWPYQRPLPPKVFKDSIQLEQVAENKALLVFGFYANFFRFEKIFDSLEFTTVSATPQGLTDVPPASTIGKYKYIFLGDVNEESVRPMIARLAAYVKNGGTLVVAGGPFSFGCGGYSGTYLEEMLPVTTKPFDCLPACSKDRDGRTAVAFEKCDAKLFWIQKVSLKKDVEVLLKTVNGDPLLVKRPFGKGTVYAFLGTPLGDEARDSKAFWNDNESYISTMRGLLK